MYLDYFCKGNKIGMTHLFSQFLLKNFLVKQRCTQLATHANTNLMETQLVSVLLEIQRLSYLEKVFNIKQNFLLEFARITY